MVRKILAVLVGVFAAGGTIALVEYVGHSLVGDSSADVLFAIVAMGYGVGALVASAIAGRIAPAAWPAIVACVLLAVLAVGNLFVIEHPIWFVPLAATLMLGGFFQGRKLFTRERVAA
ncbi:MAG: hypothetical protein AAF184_09540 [Pseudomonadota bacterium]